MKHLVPLLTLAIGASSAMASNTNDIWSYQDSDGTTLAQACNNRATCDLLYKNSHYIALVNNRSQTGCSIGDLLVAEHASRSFKKLDTGTCSPSASIEVNTYNRLNNVDVMVGDRLIKRYPLDTWMWGKIRKAGKRASWSKAEENAQKPRSVEEPEDPPTQWASSNENTEYDIFQGVNLLTIKCSHKYEVSNDLSISRIIYANGRGRQIVDDLEIDGKRHSAKVKNQEEWTHLVSTLLSASKVTVYSGKDPIAIWTMKPTQLQTPCNYYQG